MKELEPKFLTPYLPYSLKVVMEGKKTNVAWMSTKNIAVIRPEGIGEYKKIAWKHAHLNIKPILRPLTDLVKEIEHNGEKFKPFEKLRSTKGVQWFYLDHFNDAYLRFEQGFEIDTQVEILNKLFEWKFDVFRLIQNGLAIDINDLNQ